MIVKPPEEDMANFVCISVDTLTPAAQGHLAKDDGAAYWVQDNVYIVAFPASVKFERRLNNAFTYTVGDTIYIEQRRVLDAHAVEASSHSFVIDAERKRLEDEYGQSG